MSSDKLIQLAEKGDAKTLSIVAQTSSDVNAVDTLGRTALHAAAEAGQVSTLEVLLKHGAEVNAVNSLNETPLWWAARRGYSDCVAALVKNGADVNIQDQVGSSPLYWTVRNGHQSCAEILLRAGANVSEVDAEGHSPLFYALSSGAHRIVAQLIENGADVTGVDLEKALLWTDLHVAAIAGDTKKIAALLEASKTPGDDVLLFDAYRRTPITLARAHSHPEAVELLRSHMKLAWIWRALAWIGPWSRLFFLVTQLGAFSFNSAGTEIPDEYEEVSSWADWTLGVGWFPELTFVGWMIVLLVMIPIGNILLLYSPHTAAFTSGLRGLSASLVLVGWGAVASVGLVPITSTLAGAWDCSCEATGCFLDADPSVRCWTIGHIALALGVLFAMVGFFSSAARLVLVGYDARALDYVKDPFWESMVDCDDFLGNLRRLFLFIFPVAPVVALTGIFAESLSLKIMDLAFFPEETREQFLSQSDSMRIWQSPLLACRLGLTLVAVLTSTRPTLTVLLSAVIIGLMALISFFVPTYEIPAANTLNSALHGFVVWTHVVVLSGVLSEGQEWLALSLYLGGGVGVMILVSLIHWFTLGRRHVASREAAAKAEAARRAATLEEGEALLIAVASGTMGAAKGGSISAAIGMIEAPRRTSRGAARVATLAGTRRGRSRRKPRRRGVKSIFVPETPK